MIALVAIVAVLLVIATAVQILKIAELRATESGKEIYEISAKQSKAQAFLLMVFLVAYFGFFAWQVWKWGGLMLPVSASEHGVGIDKLMNITLWFIIPVFIITHIFLFWFSYKYSFSETRKALFFSHSNKLEMFWTIIPSIALTVLILVGLSNWNKIMTPVASEQEHILIEVYGQQFSWTARYAGKDGKLGRASVEYIEGVNALGIDVSDENAKDDKIVKGEFHLPVGVPVQFVFRSQDVLHSAYMPHFRAQMNCVPGLKTQFNFIPTITTEEMKKITNNENFEYILLCNKICGAAHYNMQMDIIVESKEDFEKWLAEQKEFSAE
ncbi:MAG: cytochrome C oxidase subunit II [Bacteroidetes bacterium HGW-Bacteroidetes-12]|nr:MAG: cytochrome C oxidase subunit II [Bacteroidetes bacterium HGW-Bacteroidetes-12]